MEQKPNYRSMINFEDLQKTLDLGDRSTFIEYLGAVYPDLSTYAGSQLQGISRTKFIDFLKMPIYLSEKVFICAKKTLGKFLIAEDFINFFTTLYFGTFDETVQIVFNIYDFNHDGIVNKDDIVRLLSFLPLKEDKTLSEYLYQLESIKELEITLNITFGKDCKELDYKDFLQRIKQTSDIYLQLLCYLYQRCPFRRTNIKTTKRVMSMSSKNLKIYPNGFHIADSEKKMCTPEKRKSNVTLASPSDKTRFSPVSDFLNSYKEIVDGRNYEKRGRKLEEENKRVIKSKFKKKTEAYSMDETTFLLSGLRSVVKRKVDKKTIKYTVKQNSNIGSLLDIQPLRGKTEKVKQSSIKKLLGFDYEELEKFENLEIIENEEEEEKQDSNNRERDSDSEGVQEVIIFQGYVNIIDTMEENDPSISPVENFDFARNWLTLINQDLFFYTDETKNTLVKVHNLTGCLIKENGIYVNKGIEYYCFSIIFMGKTKHFYVVNKEEAKQWTKSLRSSLQYKNFFEFYELIDNLSEGHFGVVKLGLDLKTKDKVAIKIIKKNNFNERELSLVQTEINIMKLCKYPFIIKFKEHYENSEYIFVVMEYLPYGNLLEYVKGSNGNISQRVVKRIIVQIASALSYLHSFGIVHRDIKLENIMISHQGSNFFVKLLDFGLSKILGPTETAKETCGTLLYMAPEVYLKRNYNEKVDIWSLGVLMYFLICFHFPFNSINERNPKIISENILKKELELKPSSKWHKYPKSAIELIRSCLEKDPTKRISAQEILDSEWLNSDN